MNCIRHTVAPTVVATLACVAIAAPATAAAHDPWTGSNPAATPCAADARTIATRDIRSPQSYYGRMEVRYSPSCGTNWVRATVVGSSTTIEVTKIIRRYSSQPDGQGGWLGFYEQREIDTGAGTSHGTQVYAPGATCIEAGVVLREGGNIVAFTGTTDDMTPTFC